MSRKKREMSVKEFLKKLKVKNIRGLDKDKLYTINLSLSSENVNCITQQTIDSMKKAIEFPFKEAGISVIVFVTGPGISMNILESKPESAG